MAADSRVLYLDSVTLQTVGHGLDQKLFIFVDVAIATFGEGADAQQKVPDIINTGLQPDVTFDDAIAFLHQAFRSDPGVQAFVGGITTGGAALRHVWPGKGRELPLLAELTKPPPIWSGGVKN